jgi:hypothetical protein
MTSIYRPLAEGLQSLAARMPRITREREILRVSARLKGEDVPLAAEIARREVLVWVENRSGGRLPVHAWRIDGYEYLTGGRNSAAVRVIDDDLDIWALRADDPDKNVAQRTWTTEVTVAYRQGAKALFGMRLLVSSPEDAPEIQPSVPGFVQQIISRCGLESAGIELEAVPWLVQTQDDAEALVDLLVDPTRKVPVFVLTVSESASEPNSPAINAFLLARATAGAAKVVILPAIYTWALTERVGKRLSVFGGAARAYLMGFTEDADPYGGHKLFLADRVSTPSDASDVSVQFQRIAANEGLRRLRLDHDVLSFATVRSLSLDFARGRLEKEGAAPPELLAAAELKIEALADDLKRASAFEQWLSDEQAAAEERARVAEAQLSVASYRVQQLLAQLKIRGENPDTNIVLPDSWIDFGDWCEQNLVGRVILSPRARREVRAPEFHDVGMAAKCLLWLANEYREKRISGGDGDLRVTLEGGIQNDRCGADSFKIDWRGRPINVEWHIKSGGNTRDPGRCLRIYYFWDDFDQQIVVASMPAHVSSDAS